MEITKREIILSISIICIMLIAGLMISGNITDKHNDNMTKYYKAVKIESKDMFQYGMNTNVGNAFMYGKLEAVDLVSYPEIQGDYMYVSKVKEEYTMHTRTVTTTDANGKRHTKTETYWTWDEVDRDYKKSQNVKFLDITFPTNKINLPSSRYLETIKESSHIRYQYHGVAPKHTGTMFAVLKDNTINESCIYYETNIEETIKHLESNGSLFIFWFTWIIITITTVVGLYYLDNNWLNY